VIVIKEMEWCDKIIGKAMRKMKRRAEEQDPVLL
jgi:hypothetical protein